MKRILIAIDFSPHGEEVLERAAELARASAAELWLLHVAAPDPGFVGLEVGPQHVRDARADVLKEERHRLEGLVEELARRGITAHPRLVMGQTVATILAEAEAHGCELIVAGTHGHGALKRLLLGSTAEGLIRNARRPVLVVPLPRDG